MWLSSYDQIITEYPFKVNVLVCSQFPINVNDRNIICLYFVNLCMIFPQTFNVDLTLLPQICWANQYSA